MSLREAVADVKKIEAVYRSSQADREQAAKLIGYSSLSGPAAKALAALASYGLVERAGKGELRVTRRAVAILHSDNQTERSAELRQAAFEPDIFKEMQERWPDITPPAEGIASFLRRQGFNENAIRPVAQAYLDTVALLVEEGATESHGGEETNTEKSKLSEGGGKNVIYGGAQIGDLVQWESDGVLRLEQPRRVRQISDDGMWIAVEGSETGIPMSETIVEQRAPKTEAPKFPLGLDKGPAREAGSVEWIRNEVGPETKVIISVVGEMGPREIGKLIRLLEAQKAVLEDD
jgi:hypothetical protein